MLGSLFGDSSSSGSEGPSGDEGFVLVPAAPWLTDGDPGPDVPPPSDGDPQRATETVLRAGGQSVRLAQQGADLACKGGVCWGAARSLCALFAAGAPSRVDLAGKRILELGAGTGAVGLWIAMHYPTARVTLTDLAEALPLLRTNTALNGVSDRVRVVELAFGDSASGAAVLDPTGPFDVVIGSDILYSVQCEVAWRPLAATLASAPSGATTWLAIQERYGCRVKNLAAFFDAAAASPTGGHRRGSTEVLRGDVARYAEDLGSLPLRVIRTQ